MSQPERLPPRPIRDLAITRPSPDPENTQPWEHLSPRDIDDHDWARYEGYVGEIFTALGLDLATTGTEPTPRRFLKAMQDATAGYEGDHKLITAFPTECRGGIDRRISQIVEGPISFYALCEHHGLPFRGAAHIGYVAAEQIIGISKLTRLVRVFARRFTVQERLAQQIADALVGVLEPQGVAIRIEAEHLCVQMRGVRDEQSKTVTTCWRGTYAGEPELRSEFLQEARAGGARR